MLQKIFIYTVGWICIIWSGLELSSCSRPVCAEIVCQNGGVCRDGFCQCTDGWSGAECTVRPNVSFNGKYHGALKPGVGIAYLDSILIVEDTLTVDSFDMAFRFDIYPIDVKARIFEENKFYFDRHQVSSLPEAFIEGNGMLEGDKITMYFQDEKEGEDTILNCSFFGKRRVEGD